VTKTEILAADVGDILVQVSFMFFGALILAPSLDAMTWTVVVMAALALTAVRILPVAFSMIGSGMKMPTVLYLGWFGPRGLATVVFAGIVIVDADIPGLATVAAVATATVGLSVILHGMTSYVGSEAYATWVEAQSEDIAENVPVHHRMLGMRHRRHHVSPEE